ncbi:unnamed protein product [Penicillium salamii]|uniref:Exosome complex protein n=1 Tax=Penicillium salamii TaxID=1612424 RepID=A0A9W4IN43_9EURO|nr:unnamed protein product [Penicillium salamii]CAG8260350.1 unnamed protein product [Penicillium salamii]CAG8330492.1 unnamed protein product [Penicillium salamii]
MDPADLQPLLDQLDDNVDDLEEVLQPVLASGLLKSSNKLPVMDKAKLHVLVTYALESLIFSYLKLHGVDAKQHSVFRELTRVKQYFDKIKALETEPEERPMTLDKGAASRFIKHGLAGNDKYDLERAEKQAKERARAEMKAAALARKAQKTSDSAATSEAQTNDDSDDNDSEGGVEVAAKVKPSATEKEKKQKTKGEHKSKDKKERKKSNKAALQEEKKERRQKKKEKRNARQAQ